MKKIYPILFLVFVVAGVSAQNFWTELSDLPGGALNYVEEFPNGHLIGQINYGTVYKSQDDGQTWDLLCDVNDNDYGIQKITISPKGVLFGEKARPPFSSVSSFSKQDIYKSIDEGVTWTLVATDVATHNWIEASNGKLFSFGQDGIMESSDGGQSWSVSYMSTERAYLMRIDKNGNIIASLANDNVAISNSLGSTWKLLSNHNFYLTTILPSGAYLSSKSTGSGASRTYLVRGSLTDTVEQIVLIDTLSNPNSFPTAMQSAPVQLNNGNLMVLYQSVKYISTDDGLTWESWVIACGNIFVQYHETQNGVLFSLENEDFSRSIDGTNSWEHVTVGLAESRIFDIVIEGNSDTMWVSTANSVFKSNDGGLTWNKKLHNSCRFDSYFYLNLDSDGMLYLIHEHVLKKSTDGGQTFNTISPPGIKLYKDDKFFLDQYTNTLILVENYPAKTWRSINGGTTWQLSTLSARIDDFTGSASGRLFGNTFELGVGLLLYYSDDQGLSWNPISDPLLEGVRGVRASPLGDIYAFSGTKLVRSDDSGHTWGQLPIARIGEMRINNLGHLYVYTGWLPDLSVYRSHTKGLTWTEISSNFEKPFNWSPVPVKKMVFDNAGYLYMGFDYHSKNKNLVRSLNSTYNGAYLQGTLSKSIDNDCATFDPDFFLGNILIEAQNHEKWYGKTDLSGAFDMFIDTGSYQVGSILPIPSLWDTCSTTVDLTTLGDTTTINLSLPTLADCAYITMDLVVPRLERCFDNPVYFNVCNNGTVSTDTAKLYVQLDSFLSFTDTLNWTLYDTAQNIYQLNIGFLDINACQYVNASVYVDCDTSIIGMTHCISAYTTPDSLCTSSLIWTGASLSAAAICHDSTVTLSLTNTGIAPSSLLDFIVIEDDVVLFQGSDIFNAGETKSYTYPANGSYLRIEAEQEPNHPFSNQVAAWTIGCNGNGSASMTFIFQYFMDTGFQSADEECRNNVGSYDPNDKRGFPLGYGIHNIIPKQTQIEYMVRFQNTGTAPARKVVIVDTLSAHLDKSTIHVEAASHDFTWDFIGQNVIEFTFDNIFLPDSNANEAASHGWVSYKIKPLPGLALETEVETQAGIYFDFNPAVLTNVTHHQLGENFVPVSIKGVVKNEQQFILSPNPSDGVTYIFSKDTEIAISRIEVYNMLGMRLLEGINGVSQRIEISTKELHDGAYFVKIYSTDGGGQVVKLVVAH